MRGLDRLLKRPRFKAVEKPLEPEGRGVTLTNGAQPFAVSQAPDTRVVLQEATVALEKLQQQQNALRRDMAELKKAHIAGFDSVGTGLKQKQDDIDYLHLMTSCLRQIAITQQQALSAMASDLFDRTAEIDDLREAIAKLDRPALPPPVHHPAALLNAPSSAPREIVVEESECAPDPDRLRHDKDVLRFRRHMEFVMAAAEHPWISADRAPAHPAPVVVLTRQGITASRTAA